MNRVGIGVDVHQFAAERKLVLGGVAIPHSRGLLGHSDADVVAHAVADALLGALALGDIGQFYPPDDPRCKDMDSMIIVRECAERVRQARGRINNVDITILAQEPKLAPYLPAMQETLARNLGIPPSCVGLKVTTTEHLGFTGRKEGLAALALVSVET